MRQTEEQSGIRQLSNMGSSSRDDDDDDDRPDFDWDPDGIDDDEILIIVLVVVLLLLAIVLGVAGYFLWKRRKGTWQGQKLSQPTLFSRDKRCSCCRRRVAVAFLPTILSSHVSCRTLERSFLCVTDRSYKPAVALFARRINIVSLRSCFPSVFSEFGCHRLKLSLGVTKWKLLWQACVETNVTGNLHCRASRDEGSSPRELSPV